MTHPERLHALDAVRAGALLLGIALHGSMSFVLGDPTIDVSPSATLTGLFYLIHIFRMCLFYMIAGYFACMMLERKGWREFMINRLRRIALPMLLFWFILLPLSMAAAAWGIMRRYNAEQQEFMFAIGSEGVPLLHLWFLYYLLIFYALTLTGYLLLKHSGIGNSRAYQKLRHALQQTLYSPISLLLLALPIAFGLLQIEHWDAWLGIPTHDVGLSPWPSNLLIYGLPFISGWLLFGRADILQRWQHYWAWYLGAAIALSAWCLSIAGLDYNMFEIRDIFDNNDNIRPLYALSYAIAIWCWSFGLTGCALRFCSAHNPFIRYLADASYWMYLMHLPLVLLLQSVMMDWPLHWSIKYPLLMAITCWLLLWTYKHWVRSGRIGKLLNGRRYPEENL